MALACLPLASRAATTTTASSADITTKMAATPSAATLKELSTAATVKALATSSAGNSLDGSTFGMTCDGDLTILADGNTNDTEGLLAMVAAAQTYASGASLSLPPGLCIINKTIPIPVTAPMRFEGQGIGTTTLLYWTPDHATAVVGDGLRFTVTNSASLTVDDFTIQRKLGSNYGTPYVGTAISIMASASSPAAGNVTVTQLNIYPALQSGQTDSWNIGLFMQNIAAPDITNVNVSLPGWGNIPNPSNYKCTAGGNANVSCAIHALPSPANQVATPANLAFGVVATGIALTGAGQGNYSIDSVLEGISVSGGLVGIDLAQFQGAYITDSKFVSNAIGIRADTSGTTSELLSVENSQFSDTVGGVFANGIGGMQISNNYFQATDTGTTGLPSFFGIWGLNVNNAALSGNNIIGFSNAQAPEYGIYNSATYLDAFPVTITGNAIYGLSSAGSTCLGNNKNMLSITATGNTLTSCAINLADANGGNGYGGNTYQAPDMSDDGNDNVFFPKAVTIGSTYYPGSLQILNDGKQTFYLGSSGQIFTQGSITTGGAITANHAISGSSLVTSGPLVMSGNTSHSAATEVVGNFYFPNKPSAPVTIAMTAPAGTPAGDAFPVPKPGLTTISGELTCNGNNTIISWHFDGHYGSNGTTVTPGAFSAVAEADADSQAVVKQLTGNYTITPIANPTVPGVEVVFGTGIYTTFDCSGVVTEFVAN